MYLVPNRSDVCPVLVDNWVVDAGWETELVMGNLVGNTTGVVISLVDEAPLDIKSAVDVSVSSSEAFKIYLFVDARKAKLG